MRAVLLLAVLPFVASAFAACSSAETNVPSGRKDSGPSAATPTFKADVVPIFNEAGCTLTGCHGAKGSNRGIYMPSDPAAMYPELLKPSAVASGFKLVVPSDPDNSWLMIKLDNKQAQYKDRCADPSAVPPTTKDCGQAMPQSDDPALTAMPVEKRDVVRSWIKAGAKND